MIDPIKLAKRWRAVICKDGKFGLDNDPSKSLGYPSQNMVRTYFRQWQVIKEKRNLAFDEKGSRFEGFDAYRDSWFDYPMVIRSKIGGLSWEQYNWLIAIHVPACTFSCWHCYVSDESKNAQKMLENGSIAYVAAHEIINAFLCQKEVNEKKEDEKIPTNVLRITGGEPFLMPDLLLEILKNLEHRSKSREIFVWTETNLAPFLKEEGSDRPLVEEWVDLKELAKFENLAVHPCLHGICPSNYYRITDCDPYYFNGLLDGLKTLIDYGFDVYPTFGSNVSPPHMVPYIFKRLKEIHENLPQRFALIDYELHYPPTKDRITKSLEPEEIYNKTRVIHIWDDLLRQHFGEGYPCKPRYLVSLGGKGAGKEFI